MFRGASRSVRYAGDAHNTVFSTVIVREIKVASRVVTQTRMARSKPYSMMRLTVSEKLISRRTAGQVL